MAVTKEQLEQAIRALDLQAADPTLSEAEKATVLANKTKLAIAYKTMGEAPATQPLTDAASPERTNFWADRVKYGFTDFLSRVLPDPFFDLDTAPAPGQLNTPEAQAQFGVTGMENRRREAARLKAQEWFGAGTTAPSGGVQRYAGIALESVASDPIMSALGGRGVATTALNVLGSGSTAAGGALAYDTITQVAESLGATPEWQDRWGKAAAFAGGMLASVPAASLQSALDAANQGRRILKENRDIQTSLDNASDFVVTGNMRKVIDDIVTADPKIDKHIQQVKDIAELVPKFTVGPGIALYDNPVIKKNMEVLLKESPQFRASVEASLKDLGLAVKTRQAAMFGTAEDADVVRNVHALIGDYGIKMNAANRRLDAIDSAIDRTVEAARTAKDPLDIGRAATRLIDEKEKALKAKNTAQYEYLLNTYTEKGVEFPAASVQRLHEFVGGATVEQLFTPFPTLVGKVKTLLSPKTIEQAEQLPGMQSLLSSTGAQLRPAASVKQYSPITLRQLDSLKQELNKAIRESSNNQNVLPALRRFKDVLTEEIKNIPEFGPRYREVDASFYRDLGIPFDTAGLSQLDSLKFNETVGTYLSKPERAIDFLSFVGDAGLPVVKDSILLRLQNRAFTTDGQFKPAAYAKFLNDNKAVIDTVPGLRAELNNIGNTVDQMNSVRSRLDSQAREADMRQADNFLKAVKGQGLRTAVNDILDSTKLAQYTDTLKNLDVDSAARIRNGIRTALLNRAFESTEGAEAFMKKHPAAFNTFFGSAYTSNVEALAKASDIVRRLDTSRMNFAFSYKEADLLQKATGNSIPQVTSTLRDRIASNVQKATILLSRWMTKRTADKRDAAMVDLLSSPEALDRIAKTAEAYRNNQIDVRQFAERISAISALTTIRTTSMAQEGAEKASQTPRP